MTVGGVFTPCAPCPSGAICARGTTVETLVIRSGHFRPTSTTADVRPCPNHTTDGLLLLDTPSGCSGGKGVGDALCRPGLGGLFCLSCNASLAATGGHYYDAAAVECKSCSGAAAGAGVWVVVGIAALALAIVVIRLRAKDKKWRRRHRLLVLLTRVKASAVLGSLGVMLKELISLLQLVAEFEELFNMKLPLRVMRLISSFSWLRLSLDSLLPLECLGLADYTSQLRITMTFPAVLVLLAALSAFVQKAVFKRLRGLELLRAAGIGALRWTLLITFLVFPDVCAQSFQVFRCECWDDASWLIADYSMQCTTGGCLDDAVSQMTPAYAAAHGLAWTSIVVYAIGVPSMYALLLFAVRRPMLDEEPTKLSESLSFLDDGYRLRCYWWEIVSTVHKLMVVGFATLIFPGTMMQPFVVLAIVLAYTLLLLVARPYEERDAFVMALVGQMSLIVFLVLCIIVKAEQLAQEVTTLYTPAVEKAFFHNTALMADVMLGSLVVAIATAVVFGLNKVEVAVSASWNDAWALDDGADAAEEATPALLRRAARRAARKRFAVVMARRAAKLELPALLREADLNPVQWQLIKEAEEEARRKQEQPSARGSRAGPSQPKQSPLAKLGFSLTSQDEETPTQLSYAYSVHRHLQKSKHVHGLLPEKMFSEESAELHAGVVKASKRTTTKSDPQLRVRIAARTRLEARGWRGPEQIAAWELLRLQLIRSRQGQDLEVEVEVEDTTEEVDGPDHLMDAPVAATGAAAACPASAGNSGNACIGKAGGGVRRDGPRDCGAPRRPKHERSVEQKFTGSLQDMSHIVSRNLGDGDVRTEEELEAANRAIARRKRRLSLTAGDDEWEDMIVKDRPRRETEKGLERDHCALAKVRGRGGPATDRSQRANSTSRRRGGDSTSREGSGVSRASASIASASFAEPSASLASLSIEEEGAGPENIVLQPRDAQGDGAGVGLIA